LFAVAGFSPHREGAGWFVVPDRYRAVVPPSTTTVRPVIQESRKITTPFQVLGVAEAVER
jgi:hypothetical protein